MLSRKDVFANILKYAVREFKDCTLDEIIACLDGEPEIGNVPVDDSPELIDAAGSESVSENDGIRSFDIKYKVKLSEQQRASRADSQSRVTEQIPQWVYTGETRYILS